MSFAKDMKKEHGTKARKKVVKHWAFIAYTTPDTFGSFLGTGQGSTAQEAFIKFLRGNRPCIEGLSLGDEVLSGGELYALELRSPRYYGVDDPLHNKEEVK